MNDSELLITFELEEELAITAPEMQLLADLLPDLLKDMICLQEDQEG